ncbi:anti-sigma regulatory factor (Ser/Thr protein kinase) [Streptacidiphilus sp. MAP12-33]|uniref:ATP-binding protein n=1 Tax=Streptacidiphilus sp. MAP12-33 TaxID=3156266 RepID=UPI003517486E
MARQPPALPILDRQHLRLVVTETAPRLVRALTDQAFHLWTAPRSARPDVRLVATELVTNVLQHTTRTTGHLDVFDIVLDLLPGAVRVLVFDTSRDMPIRRTPKPGAESSRGLLVVSGLARDWGAFPLPSAGKAVWADIPLSAEDPKDGADVRMVARVLGAVREL